MAEQLTSGGEVWFREHAELSFKRYRDYQINPSCRPISRYFYDCVSLYDAQEATNNTYDNGVMDEESYVKIMVGLDRGYTRIISNYFQINDDREAEEKADEIIRQACAPLNDFLGVQFSN